VRAALYTKRYGRLYEVGVGCAAKMAIRGIDRRI